MKQERLSHASGRDPAPKPNRGQVLVRIKAAGLTQWKHTFEPEDTLSLSPLPTRQEQMRPRIEAVGAGVSHLQPGHRVYIGNADGRLCRVSLEQGIASASLPTVFPSNRCRRQRSVCHSVSGAFLRAKALPAELPSFTERVVELGLPPRRLRGLWIACHRHRRPEQGRALALEQGAPGSSIIALPTPEPAHGTHGRTRRRCHSRMLANVNLAKDLTLLAKGGEWW
jgi:hypothetical protein